MADLKLLTTNEASDYLATEHGVVRTPGTLAVYRVKGGGPKYRRVGIRQVRYTKPELNEYAASVVSAPTTSTSEASARAA